MEFTTHFGLHSQATRLQDAAHTDTASDIVTGLAPSLGRSQSRELEREHTARTALRLYATVPEP